MSAPSLARATWRRRSSGGCGTSPRPLSPSPTPSSVSAVGQRGCAAGSRPRSARRARRPGRPARASGSPGRRSHRRSRSPRPDRLADPREGDRPVGPDHAGGRHHLEDRRVTQGLVSAQLVEHGCSCLQWRSVQTFLGATSGWPSTPYPPHGRRRGKPRDWRGLGDVGGVDGVRDDRPSGSPARWLRHGRDRSASRPGRRPGRRRRHATTAARRRPRRRSPRRPCRSRWCPRSRPASVVDVLVPAELLDDRARLEPEPLCGLRRTPVSGWTHHPRSSSRCRPPSGPSLGHSLRGGGVQLGCSPPELGGRKRATPCRRR